MISVVVPTYNEAENIPLIVPEILAQSPEIEVLIVPSQDAEISEDSFSDKFSRIVDEMSLESELTFRIKKVDSVVKESVSGKLRQIKSLIDPPPV